VGKPDGKRTASRVTPDNAISSTICLNYTVGQCIGFDPEAILDTIMASAAAISSVWTLIITILKNREQEPGPEDEGEVDGGDTDQGLCLTVADSVPVYGSCSTTGAASSANTWILVGLPEVNGNGWENEYWYNKGDVELLTATGNSSGDALKLAGEYPGAGGEKLQSFGTPGLTHGLGLHKGELVKL
jgi:hypothetical protein